MTLCGFVVLAFMYGIKLGPKTRTHFLPSEQYASTLTQGEVQTMGSDALS